MIQSERFDFKSLAIGDKALYLVVPMYFMTSACEPLNALTLERTINVLYVELCTKELSLIYNNYGDDRHKGR